MYLTGKNRKTAWAVWDRLSPAIKEELSHFCGQYQFPGHGQRPELVINFPGALKLTMVIGGENAKKYRSKMVGILQRYYAGDGSLLDEVEANAQSSGPVQQMARASLAAESQEEEALSLPFKKRRMELDLAKMETEIEAGRIANHAAELENEAKKIANRSAEHEGEAKRLSNVETEHEHLTKVTASYKDLCVDTVMDERARLILKDNFLNMAMLQGPSQAGGGQGLLTNGKPTSLSLVAEKLKLKLSTGELISLGQELKKKYVEKHGKPPSKHEQLCGGRATMVNTYMEADNPLIEELLRKHADAKA